MSFKEFLKEISNDELVSMGIDEAIEVIKRDCQPFLKAVDGEPLFRGSKRPQHALITKIIPRKDRRAKDNSQSFNDDVDAGAVGIIGFNPRSEAVFSTSSQSDASSYGTVYLVFPIGDFKGAYIDGVTDLYMDVVGGTGVDVDRINVIMRDAFIRYPGVLGSIAENHEIDDDEDSIVEWLEGLGTDELFDVMAEAADLWSAVMDKEAAMELGALYTTENLSRAIARGYEICLYAPNGYYSIPVSDLGVGASRFMRDLTE